MENNFISNDKVYINGIIFTKREIEVIACVIHNQSDKKIAKLLFITAKTVASHLHNIRSKLNLNSREQLIQFIEKSNQVSLFQKYYRDILAENQFCECLKQINKYFLDKNIKYEVHMLKAEDFYETFSHQLKQYLNLSNIILSKESIDNKNYNQQMLKLETRIYNNQDLVNTNYFTLITNDIFSIDIRPTEVIVRFQPTAHLHQLLLSLLKLSVHNDKVTQIVEEYNFNIENTDKELLSLNTSINKVTTVYSRWLNTKFKKLLLTLLILGLISGLIIMMFAYKRQVQQLNYTSHQMPAIIVELYNLVDQQKNFLEDNTTNQLKQNNDNIIKQINSRLVNFKTYSKEIKSYYTNPAADSVQLIKLLRLLEVISGNYSYQEHDGLKARELLEFAKDIAENYIVNRSAYKFSFNTLSYDEILTELNSVQHLPEEYTKIIYTLARTYLYQGDKHIGLKLFKLSEYLGYKLNLFEGPLSPINMTRLIDQLATINIANSKSQESQQQFMDIIAAYTKLKNDGQQYILNFDPTKKTKTIVPKDHLYTYINCTEGLLRTYNQLTVITEDKQLQQQYLANVGDQINSLKKFGDILQIFDKISYRKVATVYNNLGICILTAVTNGLDTRRIINILAKELKFSAPTSLDVAYSLFEKALSISKNNDFTKADAYDGLVNVLNYKLTTMALSQEQQDNYSALIANYRAKSSAINTSLNRETYNK